MATVQRTNTVHHKNCFVPENSCSKRGVLVRLASVQSLHYLLLDLTIMFIWARHAPQDAWLCWAMKIVHVMDQFKLCYQWKSKMGKTARGSLNTLLFLADSWNIRRILAEIALTFHAAFHFTVSFLPLFVLLSTKPSLFLGLVCYSWLIKRQPRAVSNCAGIAWAKVDLNI